MLLLRHTSFLATTLLLLAALQFISDLHNETWQALPLARVTGTLAQAGHWQQKNAQGAAGGVDGGEVSHALASHNSWKGCTTGTERTARCAAGPYASSAAARSVQQGRGCNNTLTPSCPHASMGTESSLWPSAGGGGGPASVSISSPPASSAACAVGGRKWMGLVGE